MQNLVLVIILFISSIAWSQDASLIVVGAGSAKGTNHSDYYVWPDEMNKIYSKSNDHNFRFFHYNSGGKSNDVPKILSTMTGSGFSYEIVSEDPKTYRKLEKDDLGGAKEAKKKAIWENVQKLKKAAKEGKIDRVYLAFKGHGSTPNEFNGRNENTLTLWGESYTSSDLEAIINEFPSDVQVVFSMDTCYAGGHLENVYDALIKRGDCGFATSPPHRKTWSGYGTKYAEYLKTHPEATYAEAHFHASKNSSNGRGFSTGQIFLDRYFDKNKSKVTIDDGGTCRLINVSESGIDNFMHNGLGLRYKSDILANRDVIQHKGKPFITSMMTMDQVEKAYKDAVTDKRAKILSEYDDAIKEVNNAVVDEDALLDSNMKKLMSKQSKSFKNYYEKSYLPNKKKLAELEVKKKSKRGLSVVERREYNDVKRYMSGRWRYPHNMSDVDMKKQQKDEDTFFAIWDLEEKAAKMTQSGSNDALYAVDNKYKAKFEKLSKETANLEDAYRAAKNNLALDYLLKHDPAGLEQYSKIMACEESKVMR